MLTGNAVVVDQGDVRVLETSVGHLMAAPGLCVGSYTVPAGMGLADYALGILRIYWTPEDADRSTWSAADRQRWQRQTLPERERALAFIRRPASPPR